MIDNTEQLLNINTNWNSIISKTHIVSFDLFIVLLGKSKTTNDINKSNSVTRGKYGPIPPKPDSSFHIIYGFSAQKPTSAYKNTVISVPRIISFLSIYNHPKTNYLNHS